MPRRLPLCHVANEGVAALALAGISCNVQITAGFTFVCTRGGHDVQEMTMGPDVDFINGIFHGRCSGECRQHLFHAVESSSSAALPSLGPTVFLYESSNCNLLFPQHRRN